MPPTSKVDHHAAIRRDAREGMSQRALQRKHGVGRRTVLKALASAWPEPRKPLPPRPSRLDPFKPLIDEMLRSDLDAPRKQRHTAKRIFDRLIDEHGMNDVSYQVVRGYVATRRPEIKVEAGRAPVEVFVPQSHRPGAEAEVDFGEVTVRLRGEQVVLFLFCLRMSFSGKAVHRVFASGGQEAFFEGTSTPSGAGWGADRQGPLRQPQGRGRPGAGVHPTAGGDRTLDGVPLALRDRPLLLPAG